MVPITRLNWRQSLNISAKPEEMLFLADFAPVGLVILAKCYVQPGGLNWLPFAFEADDEIVGICAIAVADTRVELFHFLIDRSVRRQGFGRQALKRVFEFAQAECPGAELRLTVHNDNVTAQALYSSFGFERTDEVRDGESVWRLSLID